VLSINGERGGLTKDVFFHRLENGVNIPVRLLAIVVCGASQQMIPEQNEIFSSINKKGE